MQAVDVRERPNIASANGSIAKVQRQTREAIAIAIDTLAWLTGEESTTVELEEGLSKCIELIRTDCDMRGVTISSHTSNTGILVPRRPLRVVLTALLLAMVDMPLRPSRIEVRSVVAENKIEIHFDLDFTPCKDVLSVVTEPRPLDYGDVQALAACEGVGFSQTGQPPIFNCRFDVVDFASFGVHRSQVS